MSTASERGVSLIEALIALVVMSIGMLGIVAMQASLRSNSDIAKQRSEAIRYAQEKVEEIRSFPQLAASSASSPYWGFDEVLADGQSTRTLNNAEYTRVWQSWDIPGAVKSKTVKVAVGWADRAASSVAGVPVINQTVTLTTAVTAIAPDLAGTLAVPGEGDTRRRPSGRSRGVPLGAKDLGNGTSGFIPPNSGGGVAWVFNNTTGVMRICTTTATVTADLTTANLTCGTDYALLVAGYIRYSLSNPPSNTTFDLLTGALATEAPTLEVGIRQSLPSIFVALGTRPCYTEIVDNEALGYYCAARVLTNSGNAPWTGNVLFDYPTSNPRITTDASDDHTTRRKVCRFFPAASSAGTYAGQTKSAVNQNYLLIRAGNGSSPNSCPTSAPTTYFHNP